MATNREKYIDNASNEELANRYGNLLDDKCEHCIYQVNDRCTNTGWDGYNGDACKDGFSQWLSQEAEEDEISTNNSELRKLVETNVNTGFVFKEIYTLKERVDKLEEKLNNNNYITKWENGKLKWKTLKDICDKIDTINRRLYVLEKCSKY